MSPRSGKAIPFVPARSVLEKILRRYGLDVRQRAWDIERRWVEIVGDKIASHAMPLEIKYRKLYVAVDAAAWATQLTLLKDVFLSRINSEFGKPVVRDISFRVAALPPRAGKPGDSPAPRRPLSSAEEEAIAQQARIVRDPALSEVLRRVMTLDAATRAEKKA